MYEASKHPDARRNPACCRERKVENKSGKSPQHKRLTAGEGRHASNRLHVFMLLLVKPRCTSRPSHSAGTHFTSAMFFAASSPVTASSWLQQPPRALSCASSACGYYLVHTRSPTRQRMHRENISKNTTSSTSSSHQKPRRTPLLPTDLLAKQAKYSNISYFG